MRLSNTLVLFCILAGLTAADVPGAQAQSSDARFVHELTHPWPFRHHAAAPAPVEVAMPGDADGDGVTDNLDKCPGTPRGARVDASGCPMDSDGDGVFDGVDKCPDTPKGATTDASGCPADSDGDGVLDGVDKCPNTPGGAAVDAKGCPEKSKTEMEFLDKGTINVSTITFKSGKSDIEPAAQKVLDEIGNMLVQWPTLMIEVTGHTDSQGSEAFNQKLSEERAAAVKAYLTANFKKIDATKLTTSGLGESQPVTTNDTEEGRRSNRRVQFTVLNKDELKREVEKRKN